MVELKKITMVISDIDGVWTDGGMYYDANGNEQKKFNTRDGMGVERLFKHSVETVICTSEKSQIVVARAKKLNIKNCFIGIKNKSEFLENFINQSNVDFTNVAYIGDDLNDEEIIEKVAFSACPNDAFIKIKNKVNLICENKGGYGAFREFAELIIKAKHERNNKNR